MITHIIIFICIHILSWLGIHHWKQVKQAPMPSDESILESEPFCDQSLSYQPLPYWTAYGLPEYWPTVLSPYWYYDVPFTGPITGSGGYYSPHTPYQPGNQRGWPDPRGPYAPHGPRPGYSGVAMGGF
jgi:hypothetical protein